MKPFIRTYLLTFLALYLTQYLVGGFKYAGEFSSPYILFTLALCLVQFFIFPVFKILGFPTKGLGGQLLRVILAGLTIYISATLIDGFTVVSTILPEVRITDFVLPSKYLSPIESLVASCLVFSIMYGFFNWLCSGKK